MPYRTLLLTNVLLGLLLLRRCADTPWPLDTTLGAPIAPAEEPVGRLLYLLLDTAGSATATDARLGLQAGPHLRRLYGPTPVLCWTTPTGSLTPQATAVFGLLAQAADYGLQPENYLGPRLQVLHDSLRVPIYGPQRHQQARLELYLSDALLRFMLDLHRGRLRSNTPSALERATHQFFQPADSLRAALPAGRVVSAVLAVQPRHRAYQQLQRALARWQQHPVPPDSLAWHRACYQKAALNLERWRYDPLADSAYILINLPAFQLYLIRHDSVLRQHRVVVGKPQTPTPTLSSVVRSFTLAPDWHVPHSIATREILPRLRTDIGYLTRNNYALYDARGTLLDPFQINWQRVSAQAFPYQIRQSAGCDNALGNIVFRFDNPYSVYLHDTPLRQFFGQPQRAFSHGCIRLEHPLELAAYLLAQEQQVVRLPGADECARQPRPQQVYLRRPWPLHIRYATCTAEKGQLQFYFDIYQRDESLRRALFAEVPSL